MGADTRPEPSLTIGHCAAAVFEQIDRADRIVRARLRAIHLIDRIHAALRGRATLWQLRLGNRFELIAREAEHRLVDARARLHLRARMLGHREHDGRATRATTKQVVGIVRIGLRTGERIGGLLRRIRIGHRRERRRLVRLIPWIVELARLRRNRRRHPCARGRRGRLAESLVPRVVLRQHHDDDGGDDREHGDTDHDHRPAAEQTTARLLRGRVAAGRALRKDRLAAFARVAMPTGARSQPGP